MRKNPRPPPASHAPCSSTSRPAHARRPACAGQHGPWRRAGDRRRALPGRQHRGARRCTAGPPARRRHAGRRACRARADAARRASAATPPAHDAGRRRRRGRAARRVRRSRPCCARPASAPRPRSSARPSTTRAAKAFAIFACGEARTYGNVLLRKGVVRDVVSRPRRHQPARPRLRELPPADPRRPTSGPASSSRSASWCSCSACRWAPCAS